MPELQHPRDTIAAHDLAALPAEALELKHPPVTEDELFRQHVANPPRRDGVQHTKVNQHRLREHPQELQLRSKAHSSLLRDSRVKYTFDERRLGNVNVGIF